MLLTTCHDVDVVAPHLPAHVAYKIRKHVSFGHHVVWLPNAAAVGADPTLTPAEQTFCHGFLMRGHDSVYIIRHV